MLINNLCDAPILANRSMMRYGRFSEFGYPFSPMFSKSNMTHVRWFWGPPKRPPCLIVKSNFLMVNIPRLAKTHGISVGFPMFSPLPTRLCIQVPPSTYICRCCHLPGHWRDRCPVLPRPRHEIERRVSWWAVPVGKALSWDHGRWSQVIKIEVPQWHYRIQATLI